MLLRQVPPFESSPQLGILAKSRFRILSATVRWRRWSMAL